MLLHIIYLDLIFLGVWGTANLSVGGTNLMNINIENIQKR